MKNTAGNLAWADLCNYKDVAMFSGFGNISWTVPAGITRIFVEAWGAGGGGSTFSGGGGGGYTAATFTVVPGNTIVMVLGEGGTSGTNTVAGGAGGMTSVNAASYSINANGGSGAPANFQMSPVMGGGGGASNTFTNYITIPGGSGKPSLNTFSPNGANNYEIMGGGGGSGVSMVSNTVWSNGNAGSYGMVIIHF